MSTLSFRFGLAQEREALEDLQRRASLIYDAYRDALLANPGAIHLPQLQLDQKRVRVAECAGAIAGFTAVLPRDRKTCDLDGLFVEPGRWKRGIGRALMQDAFALARADGLAAMEVLANPEARGFYAKLGFVRTGTAPTPFGIGFQMRCLIAQT